MVDEAYVEFADAQSLIRHVKDLPQLAVMRTLSKSHGLAGARCGTLIANPEIIALLRKVIPPYAITQLTVEAVMNLLEPPQIAIMHSRITEIRSERERVTQARARAARRASACGRATRTSSSPKFDDPDRTLRSARAANLLIREVRAQAGLPRSVRISIGTPEQNDRLIGALR